MRPKTRGFAAGICDDEQKRQNTPADGRGNAPAPQGVHDSAPDEGGRGAGRQRGSAPCYAQWRRSRPCENCVARQALEKNTRKTRLEYFGQELYEITASCVQVDGQLCVLELTRKIDRSVLLDPENGERLLNSITDEREKRYRDPLTGAYNRTYYDENYRYRSITAGVAMLDMDDLKFSNDVYGSGAGNSVLETAVSTIRRGLSEKKTA